MLDLGTLRIGIRADTDEAKSKLKGFQEETKKTENQSKASAAEIKAATSNVKDAFGKVEKAVVVAGAAIGGAFIATSKAALDSYASYEQNIGGVEKLFGKSAKQVAKDADEAFLSCQVSANQYMEQVTSFSASLIGSLGGDTEKAASYAKTAMTDMADNANVFGTSIEDIQHAYQGFAKQNFTMLDNLKLGYGGTKEEMQRLIDDANRVKEANGEMADLSIDNFADIVEAIHTMQTEMGIAGTTQNEALSTIEGSLNATKAAWDNWVTGLGNSNADMEQLTKDLVDMVVNSAKLIIPKLGEIAKAIVEQIPNIFSQIKSALPQEIQQVVDVIVGFAPVIAGAVAGMLAILNGIRIGEKITKLTELIQSLWVVLAANPILAVIGAIAALAAAFAVAYASNEDFRNSVDSAFSSIAEICQPAVEGIKTAIEEFATTLGENLAPVLESVKGLFETLSDIFGNVFLTAIQIAAPIIEMLVTNFLNLASCIVASVLPVIQQVIDAFNQFCQFISPLIDAALQLILTAFQTVFPIIQTITTSAFTVIQTVISTVMSVISDIITAVLAAINGDWNTVFSSLQHIAETIFNAVKTVIETKINAAKSIIQTCLNTIKSVWDSAFNSLKSVVTSAMENAKTAVSNGIDSIVNWFRGLGGKIKGALGNLGGLLVSAGSSIINGFLSGIKQKFEDVKSFVGGIGSWIQAHKGPKEYDLKLLIPNGGWIMESLATGLEKALPTVKDALDSVADSIQGYDFGSATVEASFDSFKRSKALDNKQSGNTTNSNTTSIVVNNYSPKTLNEKDSAREFRKSMREFVFA